MRSDTSAKGLNNMFRHPKYHGKPGQNPRTVGGQVNKLNESELLALNQCVVERLRILQQQRAQQNMTQFRLGDVVCFIDNDGREIAGIIIRLNKKTVSVYSETGGRWTVSPHFLTIIKRSAINEGAPPEASFICDIPDPLNKLTHRMAVRNATNLSVFL